MKPAVRSNKQAILMAFLVGGFALWWYIKPFPWLGVVMALISGVFTYFILTTKRMERLRRVFYIGIFVVVLGSTLVVILSDWGVKGLLDWAPEHYEWIEYYKPSESLGTLSFPCARIIPEAFFGRASYIPDAGVWEASFPTTFNEMMLLTVPFIVTGLVFGRGFCGWICPFGGLNEAMVTGKKERWRLNFLKKSRVASSGLRYAGLKEWVKDTKYGILLALVLLSVFLSFPVLCIFCPALWLAVIPVFWLVIGILVVFAIILPFMTKHRWWCHICPMGAVLSIFNKISFFRVRINKDKCIKCLDCVQECRMFAITPDDVEGDGKPNANCIRCGRCIEACPEEAIDMYWFGTFKKARGLFISLAIIAVLGWYMWFIVTVCDKFFGLF